MKDKLLKEKGTLPDQLSMNDSKSVRLNANKITKKTSSKSAKKKIKKNPLRTRDDLKMG